MSATNRGAERIDKDAYPTPLYSIFPLLAKIDFSKVKTFLEPCKGDGRILNLLPNNIEKYWCEIGEGKDYFENNFKDIDLIITNPPFSISIEFLEKSLKEGKTVCYLQRVNWLGSKIRKDFWNYNTPDKMFVLSKRPNFLKELGIKGTGDATEYAWFIWDRLNIVIGKHIEIL